MSENKEQFVRVPVGLPPVIRAYRLVACYAEVLLGVCMDADKRQELGNVDGSHLDDLANALGNLADVERDGLDNLIAAAPQADQPKSSCSDLGACGCKTPCDVPQADQPVVQPIPVGEQFCFCNDDISLQIVSGGASPHGIYGEVTLKVNGEYVKYHRAQPASAAQERDMTACANCLRPKCEHNGKLCPAPYTTHWHAWDYDQPQPTYPEYAQPAQKPEDKAEQQGEPVERGPWQYGFENGKHFIESDDFTHDVRLYIDGDFAGAEDRKAYGEMIASRLNAGPPAPQQLTDEDIERIALENGFRKSREHWGSRYYTELGSNLFAFARSLLAAQEGGK